MLSLSHSTTEELMDVAKLRNVDDYENISRQELENIFTMLSVSISTPILVSRPSLDLKIRLTSTTRTRPRCITEPRPTDIDEFEKMEMVKTRPILELIYY